MLTCRAADYELSANEDGGVLTLRAASGTTWQLDETTLLADGSGLPDPVQFSPDRYRCADNEAVLTTARPHRFATGQARRLGQTALEITRHGPGGTLVTQWEVAPEGLRVTAMPGLSTVTSCTLPGAWRPQGVMAPAVVFPKNQGVWHKGTGPPFSYENFRCGHTGWTMPFYAVVGSSEALLCIAETEEETRLWLEKTPDGRMNATWIVDGAQGRLSYARSVLLRFVEPTVAAICRHYRGYVKQCGRLVTWDEKIEQRPNLDKLFGALICFVGYQRHPTLDYGASFRALRAMGFDRAFVHPMKMGTALEGREPVLMGHPWIDLRPHVGRLRDWGWLPACWLWIEDVPETFPGLRIDAHGQTHMGWQIGDVKWIRGCAAKLPKLAERILDQHMVGIQGVHYDVTGSRLNEECHDPQHPLNRREDAQWKHKLFSSATERGLVVSSEGFWGSGTGSYDIGSMKIAQPVHADWYTVPMTSLVYHDSCIHDWWEVDNYNNPHHRNQNRRPRCYFPLGGGWAALQAAQDALAGHPPNVMPFGAQYAFVGGTPPDIEMYNYTLEMPEVQDALRRALPVTRLHRRVGKLPCVDHAVLASDGSIQCTTFSDGTRIYANFGDAAQDVPGAGRLDACEWRAID